MLVNDVSIKGNDYNLNLTHFEPDNKKSKCPIVMIHGAIENGKIFYSESGKGLAPFLCKK